MTNWLTPELFFFWFNPFTHWPVLTCDTLAAEVPLLQYVCVRLPEKILSREFTRWVREYCRAVWKQTHWLTVATRGHCYQRTPSDCRSVLIFLPLVMKHDEVLTVNQVIAWCCKATASFAYSFTFLSYLHNSSDYCFFVVFTHKEALSIAIFKSDTRAEGSILIFYSRKTSNTTMSKYFITIKTYSVEAQGKFSIRQ